MKWFLFIPYEREVYTPDGGHDTEWEVYCHIVNCSSEEKALKYLHKRIVIDGDKKYNNLSDYIKNTDIRFFPEEHKGTIKEKFYVEKEYYRK